MYAMTILSKSVYSHVLLSLIFISHKHILGMIDSANTFCGAVSRIGARALWTNPGVIAPFVRCGV